VKVSLHSGCTVRLCTVVSRTLSRSGSAEDLAVGEGEQRDNRTNLQKHRREQAYTQQRKAEAVTARWRIAGIDRGTIRCMESRGDSRIGKAGEDV
jgi:hypothetical protein